MIKNQALKIIDKHNKRDLAAQKKVNLVNEVIEEIYSSGFVKDAQGVKYPHDSSSVSFQAGALLYNFVREIKPARTIEIGMAYGLSSLFICQALLDNGGGHHTAIDPFQGSVYKSVGLLNVERAALKKNFRFMKLVLKRCCLNSLLRKRNSTLPLLMEVIYLTMLL